VAEAAAEAAEAEDEEAEAEAEAEPAADVEPRRRLLLGMADLLCGDLVVVLD